MYASGGELAGARIAADGQWRFPPRQQIPKRLADCIVAYEDRRFFYHPGFDPAAIVNAAWLNLSHARNLRGGSTITMQVARLAMGNKRRTIRQKILETAWAAFLETVYSKQSLLAMYAANAPFGGNVVGAETAAWRYFGRDPYDLSWAECAALAVLPNSPALIHPGRNRIALKNKRDRLLRTLHASGRLNRVDCELACMEPLPDSPAQLPNDAPHLLESFAAGDMKGQRITSTIDISLQQRLQQIVNGYAQQYSSNHIHNIAAILADVETGHILAYAGNATHRNGPIPSQSVDIINAERSTGSLLKPILYAAMLHEGMILPSTLIADIPLNLGGFSPRNYNRTFQGAAPAHKAIEQSLNVPLVRMLTMYGPGRFISLLKQWGMSTLRHSESHYGASLILGGAECTLIEMVGMYASMARLLSHYSRYDGMYDPADIHSLRAAPSQVRLKPVQHLTDPRLRQSGPLSYISLYQTFAAMSALNRPEEESDWQQFSSMKKIAWKTGTSYGNRDGWAIGLTPQYIAGVWVGNASGEGRPGLTGVGYAAPVLFNIFSMLPSSSWFDFPYDEAELAAVCRQSGHRASHICPDADTVYIAAAGLRSEVCRHHQLVHLSSDKKFRVSLSCEEARNIVTCPWFVLPPAQAWYYRNHHADYIPLPPFRPDCDPSGAEAMEVIYPQPGASLYLPKGYSGQPERFVFRAAHSRPNATIFWHLGDEYLGQTSGLSHHISCRAGKGSHVLVLIDEMGVRVETRFRVN
jgi:penicillin-binding protein 1C